MHTYEDVYMYLHLLQANQIQVCSQKKNEYISYTYERLTTK